MIKTKHVKTIHNLYRMIPNVFGTQIFTGTNKNDILLPVMFTGFN